MVALCRQSAGIVLAALAALAPALAEAHPHVFIKQNVAALFDSSGLAGVRLTWRFDPLYSSMMRADYVVSKQGPLSPKDVERLHDNCFVALKDEHYFTSVSLNGKPLTLGEPTDFSATSVGDSIVYSFVIPLKPATGALRPENTMEITVFDPSYYVYYELEPVHPVTVTGGAALSAACGAKVAWRDTVGWGSVRSDIVSCGFRSPGQ